MRRQITFSLLAFMLLFSSCVPTIKDDPTADNGADWQSVSTGSSERKILALRATPLELFTISSNQFTRLDLNNGVLEKRPINLDLLPDYNCVPILSDNTFVYITQNSANQQVLNFNLNKNPNSIRKIQVSDFLSAGETFKVEVQGRQIGCFSADGTKFFLLGALYPSAKAYILIFNVNLNATTSDFVSITLAKKTEVVGLAIDNKIQSCRYINGNMYLATKDGGFRITDAGTVTKLFPTWTLDFFLKPNRSTIYSTGFNAYDFQYSTDNGATWVRNTVPSDLKYTEAAGSFVFTQGNRGLQYGLGDTASLTKNVPILYSNITSGLPDSYYDVAFFHNNYYITIDKQLYISKSPKTK
jgi:hypothetical protein